MSGRVIHLYLRKIVLMNIRVLLIVLAIICFSGSEAGALEPVRPDSYLGQMIGSVRGRPSVFTPSGKEPGLVIGPQLQKAVPISALGGARAVPASSPGEATKIAPLAPVLPSRESNLGPDDWSAGSSSTRSVKAPNGSVRRITGGLQLLPTRLEKIVGNPLAAAGKAGKRVREPRVRAKALFCLECSTNKVVLSRNISQPLPIASITKLLTAMTVIDEMDLDQVVKIPKDIRRVPRHRVGVRPGDRFTVRDLLHGMLIESGNDCAEALARAYPKGGRRAFIKRMNEKALLIGARKTRIHTPSGLDMRVTLGRRSGRALKDKRPNMATAEDVATIARNAFDYPLILKIAGMKRSTMVTKNKKSRKYRLATNDKLLHRKLPVAGAKTGYTDLAGKCIVALFKDDKKSRDYMVVVLNTRNHFRAAEKIYRWACKAF
jgi:D-alanyl-D-alanine carboxypeptidase